jgi:NADH-quinone oxidoreductase subunit D
MQETLERKELLLNFGPQHPSTHGVLRVLLRVDSEYIRWAQLHYGYLHRGFEKLAEYKTYDQFVPITDRLDYLASLHMTCPYVMALEKLLGVEVPERAQYIRVILLELNRITSHLLWLGAFGIDLGAITPVMYCLREREIIIDLLEAVTGARITFNYFRIGGVKQDLPPDFAQRTLDFLEGDFFEKIEEYDVLLKQNRVFLARTKDVGVVSAEEAINYGFTGPSLRGSGVKWDIRKREPYLVYDKLNFEVPVGQRGDTYERYLVRLEEIRQSAKMVIQALKQIPEGEIMSRDPRIFKPRKEGIFDNVESLIQYCYLAMEGISVPRGEVYFRTEGPRGEIGYYIVSDGSNKPYRVFIRVPSFINLTIVPKLVQGKLMADLAAVLGGFDLVMGEVDK